MKSKKQNAKNKTQYLRIIITKMSVIYKILNTHKNVVKSVINDIYIQKHTNNSMNMQGVIWFMYSYSKGIFYQDGFDRQIY